MKIYDYDHAAENRIENNFIHHAPKDGQAERYKAMRDNAKDMAMTILSFTPPSREQSLALTKLEEVVFWANAAIARNE
jgi:hypothetical protein